MTRQKKIPPRSFVHSGNFADLFSPSGTTRKRKGSKSARTRRKHQVQRRPYKLRLTAADASAIHFVGDRYGWSSLLPRSAGLYAFTEPEMWEWVQAVEKDMRGGHSPFPMLNEHSNLYEKLVDLWQSVV